MVATAHVRACVCAQVRVGRGYGRVGRRLLREHLLATCTKANVKFLPAEVRGAAQGHGVREH